MQYQAVHLYPPPHEVEMTSIDIEDPPSPVITRPPSVLKMLHISLFGLNTHMPTQEGPLQEKSHV